jgi:hypothetical protein
MSKGKFFLIALLFENRMSKGVTYNVTAIVNNKFEIDMDAYNQQGHINMSIFFSISYGIGFATIVSTLTHVAIFNGK